MEKIPLTQKGFDKLDEELKRLKSQDRPSVIRAIAEAREHARHRRAPFRIRRIDPAAQCLVPARPFAPKLASVCSVYLSVSEMFPPKSQRHKENLLYADFFSSYACHAEPKFGAA